MDKPIEEERRRLASGLKGFLRDEIGQGLLLAADPSNAGLPELAVRSTTVYSPWYAQTCIVCMQKFREADRVRLCPKCGRPYHDDDKYDLPCWQTHFGGGGRCTRGGVDRFSDDKREIAGCDFTMPEALFTHRGYGPVTGLTWWRKGCEEPIRLVTNMQCADEACRFYEERFLIETCFSDQKGRGFNLQKKHMSNPERINRLLMAVFLAYYWIVAFGVSAVKEGWQGVIHRRHRCDLSLFQLGLALFDYLLEENMPVHDPLHMIC